MSRTKKPSTAAVKAFRKHLYKGIDMDDLMKALEAAYEADGCGEVPELIGTTQAAEACAATTSNLGRLAGLPEPLDQPLVSHSLWVADEIREFARERRAAERARP